MGVSTPPPSASRWATALPRLRRGLAILAAGVGGLALLVLVMLAALDTGAGRRVLAAQIGHVDLGGGIRLRVASLEGSLWRRMTLRGVTLSDRRGVFLRSPSLSLAWRPGRLLRGEVRLDQIYSPEIRLIRLPQPGPTPARSPSRSPDVHLDLERLRVDALDLGPAGPGAPPPLRLDARAEVLKHRLKLDLRAMTPGGAGPPDQLEARLDLAPDQDRLAAQARLMAPRNGALNRLLQLDGDLSASLEGRGDWRWWTGDVSATLGGHSLAAARLSARSGTFRLKGRAAPGLVVRQGPWAALAASPAIFDLALRPDPSRRTRLEARVSSARYDVRTDGELDLAHDRFEGLAIALRLQGDQTLPGGGAPEVPRSGGPNSGGSDSGVGSLGDLAASARLDGAWSNPSAIGTLSLARLSVQGVALSGLGAAFETRPDTARGRRVTLTAHVAGSQGLPLGLDALAAGSRLTADLRLRDRAAPVGVLSLDAPRLHAGLRLRSSARGLAGDLAAHAAGYDLNGLGEADVDLTSGVALDGRGRLSLDGVVGIRAFRAHDATLDSILAGRAKAQGRLSLAADGDVALHDVVLDSTGLSIVSGEGRLSPDGAVALSLRGRSRDYGPLTLSAGGTLAAPRLRLEAANPSPLGLRDLVVDAARRDGSPAGVSDWSLQAAGDSDYGRASLDAALRFTGASLSARIDKAGLGPLRLTGKVRMLASGILAGDLTLAGAGLNGGARLDAVNGVQGARVSLSGRDVRLPLRPDLTLSQGKADLLLSLPPTGPTLTGSVRAAGARWSGMSLSRLDLDLGLHKGSGQVRFSAAGSAAAAFALKGVAEVTPGLIQLSGSGMAGKMPLRLEAPARLYATRDGYRLDRAAIILPHGRLILSGQSDAAGTGADLVLDSADLALLHALDPDLDVAGAVTGEAQFTAPSSGAIPTGRLTLRVSNFTRGGVAAVAAPMDLAVQGAISPEGGRLSALARQGGSVIGRVQVALDHPGAATTSAWWDRLAMSEVSGGVRYQGPAEALWALGSLGAQTLSGPLAIGADVSGRLDAPQLRGVVRGTGLRFTDSDLGMSLQDIDLDGRFEGARLELNRLTARAGEGQISASGYADLTAANGFPVQLALKLNRARILEGVPLDATVSGAVDVTHDRATGGRIFGALTLDKASYAIGGASADTVIELTGVRRKGEAANAASAQDDALARASRPSAWKLDVAIRGGSHIFVSGMGLDAEWRAALRVSGDLRTPRVTGDVDLVRGSYEFAGRKLSLSRGVIHLDGSNPPNPTLDIQATTTAEGVTANVNITGTANRPRITFSSSPALPEDQVLARLLFGASATNISPVQAVQLAASLNALREGGSDPTQSLRKAIKLDRLSVYAADPTLNRGAAVGAGKYIGSRVYVEVTTDARGYAATEVEVALTKAFRLLSQVGTMIGGTSINLQYTRQY